jgi:hypothetical protein
LTAFGRGASFSAPVKGRIAFGLSLPIDSWVIRSSISPVGLPPAGDLILEASLGQVQDFSLQSLLDFIVAFGATQVKSMRRRRRDREQ